jgi:hypothetical protein
MKRSSLRTRLLCRWQLAASLSFRRPSCEHLNSRRRALEWESHSLFVSVLFEFAYFYK